MIMDVLLAAIGFAGLLAATWVDIKTKEIPDWITYGMIFTGFSLRLINSIVLSLWSYFYYAIFSFLLMLVIGWTFYYTRQWGGGDAKLIMGLGVIFATTPFYLSASLFPFPIVLLMNILLMGALYGLFYGIFLALRYRKKFVKDLKFLNRQKRTRRSKIFSLCIALILIFIMIYLVEDIRLKLIISSLSAFTLLLPYLRIFVRSVENSCLYQIKKVKDLTEGDWVEQDVVIRGKVIYRKKPLGIEKDDIQRLKDAKVKQIIVKEGIPFAPPFLFGLLVTLLYGNIILVA